MIKIQFSIKEKRKKEEIKSAVKTGNDEAIIVAYLYIKTISPHTKIVLPHENHKKFNNNDITFFLPTQTNLIENNKFNFAFNKASFGEMNIETVNLYLDIIYKKLKTGGELHSINQIESRHIKGNKLANYNPPIKLVKNKIYELPYLEFGYRHSTENGGPH